MSKNVQRIPQNTLKTRLFFLYLTHNQRIKNVQKLSKIQVICPYTCTTAPLHVAYPQQGDKAGENFEQIAYNIFVYLCIEN